MKKKIITLTLIAALSATATTAFAAPIPRESAPLNATEAQIQITENIVGDILDEVQTGKLGYTLAAGYANTKIRKAVMANQTDGCLLYTSSLFINHKQFTIYPIGIL